MDVYKAYENIKTKKDFDFFLDCLFRDFQNKKNEWENHSLEYFLEGLSAYSEDSEGYYINNDIPYDESKPTWKVFAQLLLGAKVYE